MLTRRYPHVGGYSHEQAKELAALSRSLGRQIGVCIDRRGNVRLVIVGTPSGLFIPELPRSRESTDRLRGIRLLHTHLTPDLLSQEDCTDMLFLRLDSIAVLTVSPWGEPLQFQSAHLLPPTPAKTSHSISAPVAWNAVTRDFLAETLALEAELAGSGPSAATTNLTVHGLASDAFHSVQQHNLELSAQSTARQRAILVSVSSQPKSRQETSLLELAELAYTADVLVAGLLSQRVQRLDPRYILGQGKLAELETLAMQADADMLIFDGELAPSQLRNLTNATSLRVLDRTQLILDIFAQRAASKAGKLQVELAQLQYRLPRLVRQSSALDRLAGGIGGKGPGETKLETDRRKVRERITRLKAELQNLQRHRAATRDRRAKSLVPTASLVGYTNAGKSSLLNILTGATVLAENKLFATLDPTTRRLRFPQERELILTDTVGFITHLPATLLEAFKATLEELEAAHLLVHVVDAAHPNSHQHIAAVNDILEQLALQHVPVLLVLNKCELISPECTAGYKAAYPDALFISAHTGQGLEQLTRAMIQAMHWPVPSAFSSKDAEFSDISCPSNDYDNNIPS